MGFPSYLDQSPKEVREAMVSLMERLKAHRVDPEHTPQLTVDEFMSALRIVTSSDGGYVGTLHTLASAAKTLYGMHPERLSTKLISLFEEHGIRRIALFYIFEELQLKEAIPALIPLLKNADPILASEVTRTLGRLKSIEAVQPIVSAILDRRIGEAVGYGALEQIGSPETTEMLEAYYRKRNWPQTVDEAVNQLLQKLDAESIETLRRTPKDDLVQFHDGFGMGIRNSFGLWGRNDSLFISCGLDPREGDADDASMVIIEALSDRIQAME